MVGKLTDLGNKRSLNEDYLDFYECSGYGIYVIADGMGGHNAGEVASKMVVEGIIDFIKLNHSIIVENEILQKAIQDINYKVYKYSLSKESLEGMGTTVTAAYLTKNKLFIANVGDSSCYAVNKEEILKITRDHSLVQELLDSGSITEEEAKTHPRKNIITRAVGTSIIVHGDIYDIDRDKFKTFVLCTDGLTNDVSSDEMFEIINSTSNSNEACNKLVGLAKARGGKDNISVLIFGGEM